MTDGSILLFPAGDDIGKLIEAWTGGPPHVGICVDLIFDDTLYKAPGRLIDVSGVRETIVAAAAGVLGAFKVRDPVVAWTEAEKQKALQAALDYVNARRRYNILQLVAESILWPLWKLGLKWDPFKNSKEMVCSTFVAMVYRATGRDPWPGRDTAEIAPVDFVSNPEWKDA